jgi:hypothetical protein
MRHFVLLLPGILVATVACGGEAPSASSPPASSATITGTITAGTTAQHKLAHLRTADGMVGLVLDRSGAKPKFQIDGKSDIVELTQKEQRESWEHRLEGYFLVDPAGARAFFIDEGGGITYLPDHDRYSMMFDKDVAPLGAATVTGTYAPPPPSYKATVDKLTAIAVRTRFPEVKIEDSANLTKVSDVIARATADMFVHYTAHGQADWQPHLVLAPQGFTGVSFGGVGYTSDDVWDPKAKGLSKYGGKNQGFSHYDTPRGNHMQVMTLHGYPPKLGDGTPGIVWEVDGTRATFVSLDGGRYEIDLSKAGDKGQTLDVGAGPVSAWPAAAGDALLTVPDVSTLAKVGSVPQSNIDDLLALDDKWTQCAAKVWGGAQRQVDTGHFNEADRKDYEKKVRTTCAGTVQSQEALLVKIVETRLKDRMDLYGKAKLRVTQVAADH